MSNGDAPSPADQELIDYAAAHVETVTPKQLRVWRERGLLEPNIVVRLGRGRGTASRPAEGAGEMVLWLSRHTKSGGRPDHLALLAFAQSMPVPETTVRAAFRRAVDHITLKAEQDGAIALIGDPQEQAEAVAQAVAATGQLGILVPARVRRLDEAIRDLGVDLGAPDLAKLDRATRELAAARAADLMAMAVDVVRRGAPAVHNQGLGDFFRAVCPAGAVNPIASLVEYLDLDNEGPGVQDLGGVLPDGDVRDRIRDVLASAPLPLVREAWHCVTQLRTWGEDFCAAAEADVAAGRVGPAAIAWSRVSLMPTRLFLISVLRPERDSPPAHARTAAELLMLRDMLHRLEDGSPGLVWSLLDNPDLMPDCVRTFLVPAA